jgi:flavorubredoxin
MTHALSYPYELDGRVTWHPPGARGVASMNSYLLVDGDRALLIDTGLTVHQDALLADLRALGDLRIDILHTRLGEYNSLCNTPAVVAAFDVDTIYGPHDQADLWTDFMPHGDGLGHGIGPVRVEYLKSDHEIDVGPERRVRAFSPVLRLLPTHWVHDPATKTLFTSDMFSHVLGPPGVVTGENDTATLEDVREHMLSTRYWWVRAADTRSIVAELAAFFDATPIERICPGFGRVLEGRAVVERHVAMVIEVLTG